MYALTSPPFFPLLFPLSCLISQPPSPALLLSHLVSKVQAIACTHAVLTADQQLPCPPFAFSPLPLALVQGADDIQLTNNFPAPASSSPIPV